MKSALLLILVLISIVFPIFAQEGANIKIYHGNRNGSPMNCLVDTENETEMQSRSEVTIYVEEGAKVELQITNANQYFYKYIWNKKNIKNDLKEPAEITSMKRILSGLIPLSKSDASSSAVSKVLNNLGWIENYNSILDQVIVEVNKAINVIDSSDRAESLNGNYDPLDILYGKGLARSQNLVKEMKYDDRLLLFKYVSESKKLPIEKFLDSVYDEMKKHTDDDLTAKDSIGLKKEITQTILYALKIKSDRIVEVCKKIKKDFLDIPTNKVDVFKIDSTDLLLTLSINPDTNNAIGEMERTTGDTLIVIHIIVVKPIPNIELLPTVFIPINSWIEKVPQYQINKGKIEIADSNGSFKAITRAGVLLNWNIWKYGKRKDRSIGVSLGIGTPITLDDVKSSGFAETVVPKDILIGLTFSPYKTFRFGLGYGISWFHKGLADGIVLGQEVPADKKIDEYFKYGFIQSGYIYISYGL
ncbi:MAG: hypothetical protein HYZ54_10330 [Ignavibacteriae bacterium]|nr:hypothetical protein [Ignavibacteriota bacterium]